MPSSLHLVVTRLAFALAVFAMLALAITSRAPKHMLDFDQLFYLTIAHDLDRHGVFSNGIYDDVDSSKAAPPPGMFFAPLYPWLVVGVMKLDAEFADAVACHVEANEAGREPECRTYARPMLLIHALLLTIGVIAIGRAGEAILGGMHAFYLVGGVAAAGVALEAELLSFIMTESLCFSLYSILMLTIVLGLKTARLREFALAGLILGILCLVKVVFLILAPVLLVLVAAYARWLSPHGLVRWARNGGAFAIVFLLTIAPWPLRNHTVLGKLAFSEEYGSGTLIERLAFNDMSAREFALAFPYCLPIGPALVNRLSGSDAMARFEWNQPGSFFEVGRGRRNALTATHGRLDPLIGGILGDELPRDWWRHLATIAPLAWCGLWMSGLWSLLVIPLFAVACGLALRRSRPTLLFYAAPAFVLVGLHATIANQYPRYNLGLIGPFSVGAAGVISRVLPRRERSFQRDAYRVEVP